LCRLNGFLVFSGYQAAACLTSTFIIGKLHRFD
jgi:hypothetical protein